MPVRGHGPIRRSRAGTGQPWCTRPGPSRRIRVDEHALRPIAPHHVRQRWPPFQHITKGNNVLFSSLERNSMGEYRSSAAIAWQEHLVADLWTHRLPSPYSCTRAGAPCLWRPWATGASWGPCCCWPPCTTCRTWLRLSRSCNGPTTTCRSSFRASVRSWSGSSGVLPAVYAQEASWEGGSSSTTRRVWLGTGRC